MRLNSLLQSSILKMFSIIICVPNAKSHVLTLNNVRYLYIMRFLFILIITRVYIKQSYDHSLNDIWTLIISYVTLFNIQKIIRLLKRILHIFFLIRIFSFFTLSTSNLISNIFHFFFEKEIDPKQINKKSYQSKHLFRGLFMFICFVYCYDCCIGHYCIISGINSNRYENYPFSNFDHFLNRNGSICRFIFTCEGEHIDQGRSYDDNDNILQDCYFSRLSSFSADGGVIYVIVTNKYMNVSNTMFFNCSCTTDGGAIFFKSYNSNLKMVCASRCYATSEYHFAFIRVNIENHVEYLSVTYCSHMLSGMDPIRLYNGKMKVDNTNSSINSAYQDSGIAFQSSSQFISTHCTFSNNIASHSVCIRFEYITGTMKFANIVHNNSPNDYGVVLEMGANTKMEYCIFMNNQNILFYVFSNSLEVSHSFINHSSSSYSRSSSVSISSNNSLMNTFTYQIQFFSSVHCNADIPLPPRTIEQSPMRSLEETARRTIDETLRITLANTCDPTKRETHIETVAETLMNTLNKTPMNTLEETPLHTLNETPMHTYEETPINTLEETVRESPKATLPRTYSEITCTNQMVYKKEISVVFSNSFLFAAILISLFPE